jgi:programmed cell death protein 4
MTTALKEDHHSHSTHSHSSLLKPKENDRLDRHSGSGLRGLPKKQGYAGKGGWGKAGTGEDGESVIDTHDPNYASDDEEEEKLRLKKVGNGENTEESLLTDYFVNGDTDETIKQLLTIFSKNNKSPQQKHNNNNNTSNEKEPETDTEASSLSHFLKKAIYSAFDRQAYERELVSRLLSQGYGKLVAREDVELGFREALQKLEDVVLDSPEAPQLLAKFMARAIADDILSPSFLNHEKNKVGKAGTTALELAGALSSENHRADRLSHIWGPGDMKSVKRMKKEVKLILDEFLVNNDFNEAEKSVRNINVPSFHFQVVKMAVRTGIEKGTSERSKIIALLKHLSQVSLISEAQTEQGFKCCIDTLADLKLDVPNAKSLLDEMIQQAKNEKIISSSFSS